jgi:hypothetical protein
LSILEGVAQDILLAEDNSELQSPFNGRVKKIKFTTTNSNTNRGDLIILSTGHIDDTNKYFKTDSTILSETISPPATYNLDLNLPIKAGDQIFVGFNSRENNQNKLLIVGINTSLADNSYYWCLSRLTANVLRILKLIVLFMLKV